MKNAVPNAFKKVFVEHDFIKLAKMKCENDLLNALKNKDEKLVEEMLIVKMLLNSSSLKVKDNVAVISSDYHHDVVFSADDNSMSCNDEKYYFDFDFAA